VNGVQAAVWSVCVLMAQAQPQACAQASLKEDVAQLAQPIIAAGRAPGISIGILDDTGRAHYFAFGTIDRLGKRAPDRDTLFEIGSITKCFTAILLAAQVESGAVRLDDPAQRFVPNGVRLPRVSNRPITLEDLATYSAGLPRMPSNAGDLAHYSRKQMFDFLTGLSTREGGRSPERHYKYSNLGFGLLGQCLSDRAGEPVRNLIVGRVCRPLGMPSTLFEPEAALADHFTDTSTPRQSPSTWTTMTHRRRQSPVTPTSDQRPWRKRRSFQRQRAAVRPTRCG
jgi:D-alanyl-D-alanine-carboxypeptidase/D-alanyl-D-alanine-endopeptidase